MYRLFIIDLFSLDFYEFKCSLFKERFYLGLGDSGYPKFNLVAKKLSKRLVQLGGMQILNPGR